MLFMCRFMFVKFSSVPRLFVDEQSEQSGETPTSLIRVFLDGRDPEIAGRTLVLPRRELRTLEHLVSHQGKWLTKTQLFNSIYGLFDSSFDENVIESHVSKLRKKLRDHLGYDPIEVKAIYGISSRRPEIAI